MANLEKMWSLTEDDKKILAKQLFVVKKYFVKDDANQLFEIYENNDYNEISSFISADTMMHLFHMLYDSLLRKIEETTFLPVLEKLSLEALEETIQYVSEVKNEKMKEALMKNMAYFTVITKLLGLETPSLPEEVMSQALAEISLIENKAGFEKSKIIGVDIDFTQFTPRGHYTRSEDLTRYFKAMMYMGLIPLEFKKANGEVNKEMTLSALAMTYAIFSNEWLYAKWNLIYGTTALFVGESDDLGVNEYGAALADFYKKKAVTIDDLVAPTFFDEFVKSIEALPGPRIKGKFTMVGTPVEKQFRLMGQRFILDSEILQNLVNPLSRPIPSGLDVMAAFGSKKAQELQLADKNNEAWSEYPETLALAIKDTASLKDADWMENIYTGWMWSIQAFLKKFGEGYPSFMYSDAWELKSINSALASWATAKHDTILYGKQSGSQMGGEGEEIPEVKGYVEPNIELYARLQWTLQFLEANLEERGLKVFMGSLEDMIEKLDFLIKVSKKELENEPLTAREHEIIRYHGGWLERRMIDLAEVNHWFEITSETDKNMPLVADFHTVAPNQFAQGGYIHAAVGKPQEIYVIVPIDGKLSLTRGAVFRYYEFEAAERYTDEKWQAELKSGNAPGLLYWQKPLYFGGE